MLSIQIDNGYHLRIGASNNNFKNVLPALDSNLVNYTIKDPYIFDFLLLKNEYKEKALERRIKMKEESLQVTNYDFLIYKDGSNNIKVNVLLINNDLWLTQDLIVELFGTARSTITEHINNILNDGELLAETSVGISDISSGGRKPKIYNLDMIIAVGYRVNSKRATNFRIWATKVLKEFMIKGVVMDDERLKNPNYIFGEDYFEETLERIRNIRSSERKFYQKITDIYSQCSIDYDKNAEITKNFFKTVQNKLHYAITGNTAAEIVYNRVDYEKEHMGLTNCLG